MTRQFEELLFLGNGDHSSEQVEKLKARLQEGLQMLSALQQPPRATDQPLDPNRQYELEQDVREAVRDIAIALTGREIEFR